MKERGVRSYLEIGARHGDTFFDVMASLPVGSYGLAMDLPGGLWGTSKSVSSLEGAAQELRRMGYDIVLSLGDSQSEPCIETAQMFAPFDAVLIDGDHLYDGVKADWINYGPLAPLVAFHDIVGQGQAEKVFGNPVEVPKFWQELKDSGLDVLEFIGEGSKMGIGVVCK